MKKKWWHGKAAYQIYPKSFCDSNGDGIGDLQGIIEKLDYLKDLGIDIVWISPIYQSPFVDQGYDISDYYALDPAFGTMEDMDMLLAEAKKRDIKIIMDLVVNHCSDQHEWFKKAAEDPYGTYGKYFYIMEGKDGKAPCNWRSYFGGSVWDKLPGHDNLYYLHMFAKEQPDLNWENPELREEIYKMIRWWLKKGVAGFRLDAIINIKKDLRFQDFPADREDGMCAGTLMLKYAKGVHTFLQEMKEQAFAPFDAFTIGELFDFRQEELERYIGEDGCFESIFDFAPHILGGSSKGWYDCRKVTPDQYKGAVFASKAFSQDIGMMANIIENHDEPRGVSHYLPEGEVNETSKKMLGGLMMMAFGLPFLYQGQEIGMTNKKFTDISEVDDISTLEEYHVALEQGFSKEEALKVISHMSRDNARTPMQWSSQSHCGFTEGKPWLKENENYIEINVKEQETREDSVLSFYKAMLKLRKSQEYGETIVYGRQMPWMEERSNLMAFKRTGEEKTLLVLANFQKEEQKVQIAEPIGKVVADNLQKVSQWGMEAPDSWKTAAKEGEQEILLKGYQFLVLEL
ncbi:MAG: alpha-glucosidase [Lachnospiraceae bacterium]|nr:alpha-glucosidase [Lachnospiraceae bacterium]